MQKIIKYPETNQPKFEKSPQKNTNDGHVISSGKLSPLIGSDLPTYGKFSSTIYIKRPTTSPVLQMQRLSEMKLRSSIDRKNSQTPNANQQF